MGLPALAPGKVIQVDLAEDFITGAGKVRPQVLPQPSCFLFLLDLFNSDIRRETEK